MNPTLWSLCLFAAALTVRAEPAFPLRTNDVVAFVGGGDVSAMQQGAHLESLLACAWPTARFRNFGWEGDTVYAQPRDFNFPPLPEHLRKAGVTVVIVQFGRTEALSEQALNFNSAYEKFVTGLEAITSRVVLVAPPPLENGGGLLPNLAEKNVRVAENSRTIKELAETHHFSFVDLFATLPRDVRLTDDGLQLTLRGQAACALTFASQLGLQHCVARAGHPNAEGSWSGGDLEQLRKAIILKNRSWFNYWRPQNWAFLGGDRTEQPSSRDYRDPKVRWFPKEIEQFRSLIANQEADITRLATAIDRSKQ